MRLVYLKAIITVLTISSPFNFANSQVPTNATFYDSYQLESERLLDGPVLSGRTTKIDFSENGDLYLLDTGRHEIIVYDKDLKEKFSFGRRGKGPGEFQNPADIYVDVSTVFVMDGSLLRITAFSLSGELMYSIPIESRASDMIYVNNLLCTHTGGIIPRNQQQVNCYDTNTHKLKSQPLEPSEVIGKRSVSLGNATFNTIQTFNDGFVVLQHPIDVTISIFGKNGKLKNKFIAENELYQQPKLPENYNMLEHKINNFVHAYADGMYVFNGRILLVFVEFGTGDKFMDMYDMEGNRMISEVIDMQRVWPVYVDQKGSLYSFSYTEDKEGINLKKYIVIK